MKPIEEVENLERITEQGMHWVRLDRVMEIIKHSQQQLLESLEEEVEEMFSVYPEGGIHDFKEDEELISKVKVKALIQSKKTQLL